MNERHPSPGPLAQWSVRLAIGVWAAFWTWFAVCVMASEGTAWQPVLGLALLLGTSAAACLRPRVGGGLLAAFGGLTAWLFADMTAVGIFSAPAIVLGVLAVVMRTPRPARTLAV